MRIGKYVLLAAAACATAAVTHQARAAVVFSDNFSSSTIATGAYPTPTPTSTGYAILGAKNQSPAPAVAPGHLTYGIAATTGGIEEMQALFATSPVALNVGDAIEMKVLFQVTGILTAPVTTTTGQIDFGMYNSNGTSPKTNLQASGLSSTLTADATGGAGNWQGYVSQVFQTGGSSPRVVTRPAQTGPDNTNQDAVTNNASSSQSYHSPTGTSLGSTGTAQTLLTSTQYFEDFIITLTAAGTYQIKSNLYQGSDATGILLSAQTANATAANFFGGGFDALAIGWRETANQASLMDISNIEVSTIVPEPASMALLGIGGLLLRRRAAQ